MKLRKSQVKKYALILSGLVLVGLISFFWLNKKYTQPVEIKNLSNLIDVAVSNLNGDIEPQKPLASPPKIIKAAYATGWSAGSSKKVLKLIDLLNSTELNALVVDVKDYTGTISYITNSSLVKKYNAEEKRIPKINTLIKQLHDEGIYVIGRIVIFEDQKLATARPDLALHSKKTGELWATAKGAHWLDPFSREVWDYNIGIAEDALSHGFDEINFDYIRFASDGDLTDIVYPFYSNKILKKEVIRSFFSYLREKLGEAKLSADLFGMATTNNDDLGIGQYLENALPYFDAISPMVYPSHYITGFLNFKNPAKAPYEVVRYSMDQAVLRMQKYQDIRVAAIVQQAAASVQAQANMTAKNIAVPLPIRAKLRPWLQDFNLGATYGPVEVGAQIKAVDDADLDQKFSEGWMLWNSSNVYTKNALRN